MLKIIGMIIFSLVITGCATHSQHGNFISKSEILDQDKIAVEAIDQIVKIYPPAKTQFEVKQPTPDRFGLLLISGLREKGYALHEFALDNKGQDKISGEGLPFYYVLDKFK